jgi:predicted kinase
VVLMCGIAGAGKTTYAKALEAQGWLRLSIDEEVWARFGRYGIDYDAAQYAEHSAAAESALRQRLMDLIAAGHDVVVDFSFWQRAARERYKRLVEESGGQWQLIYLKVAPEVLRERLARRNAQFDANAPFPITEAILDHYLAAFEEPHDEGETVVLA